MERIEDFRLTSTPRVLLALCIVLLLVRIGLSIFDWIHPAERTRSVGWLDAEQFERDQVNPGAYAGAIEPRTAPLPKGKNRLKLYEFYAAWCSPCERLERDVMSNNEIRACIESNFIPLRVTDRQREDNKNSRLVTELQKKYRVFAFPTIVAVDQNGEAIGSLVGNSSSLAVYRFLGRVQNEANSPK